MTTPCETCSDTHRMWSLALEREVPCTRCPVPCSRCAESGGRGAYCATSPCRCFCHESRVRGLTLQPLPAAVTRDGLLELLRRWRELPSEPQAGDGLCATDEVIQEQRDWNALYAALVAETDAALAAEGRS